MGDLFALMILLNAFQPSASTTNVDDRYINSPEPIKINILVKQFDAECAEQTGDEIVVCGKRTGQERYRLRRNDEEKRFDKEDLKAEFSISETAKMAAEAEAAQLGEGERERLSRFASRNGNPDIEARSIPGLANVDLMRRELDNEVEFATIMWFQDLRIEAEI